MSFPVVETTATYVEETGTLTSLPVTLPSGIVSGNLLILALRAATTSTATTPTGWTLLTSRSNSGVTYIWYRIADGSEGATVTVTISGAVRTVANSYRIRRYTGLPEAVFAGTATVNPPSLAPSWGSADNLFIALMSSRTSDDTIDAGPTNYTDLITASNVSSSNTARVIMGSARRQLAASSDDPDTFTVTGTTNSPHAATIVIQGLPLPVIDDLILHLDASSLELDDQDPVTVWNDLSPSGLVLVDGAFTPPTFVTPSLNGLGGVSFPSNNTALEDTSSVSLAGPRTIFLVVHTPDEDATWRYIHPQGAGLLIVKGPGAGNFIFGSDGGSGQFIEFTDVAFSDTDVLFTFVQQTTGAFVRADQVQKVSGNLSSVPAITTVHFGNTGGSAGSGGISFVLHEVVMYDGVLSSGDIDLVEDYLFDKWFGAPATITVIQAPEVESAQPITPLISREVAVGQAVEAELGQTIDPQIARRVTVSQASETELGQSVTPVIGRMVPVGTAAEAEAANPVTPRINRVITIGIATEVELARLISPIKPIIVPVQTAVERELARLVTPFKGQPFIPGITCEVLTLGVDCAILALNVDCEQP